MAADQISRALWEDTSPVASPPTSTQHSPDHPTPSPRPNHTRHTAATGDSKSALRPPPPASDEKPSSPAGCARHWWPVANARTTPQTCHHTKPPPPHQRPAVTSNAAAPHTGPNAATPKPPPPPPSSPAPPLPRRHPARAPRQSPHPSDGKVRRNQMNHAPQDRKASAIILLHIRPPATTIRLDAGKVRSPSHPPAIAPQPS